MAVLTDYKINASKSKAKEYTLKDGNGLFLNIHPNGSKYWLFRFSWNGKQTRMSFGTYPTVDIKQARYLCEQANFKLLRGIDPRLKENTTIDPVDEVLDEEPKCTFAQFAQHWLEFKMKKLNSKPSKDKKNNGRGSTEIQIRRAFTNDIFPVLKDKSIHKVTRNDLLCIIRKVEKRGALSVAEKIRSWLDEIFRYAVVTEGLEINPAADLDIASLPYRRNNRYPFIDVSEIPELLVKLSTYQGSRLTVLGLRLLLLTGVRTGELRFSEAWQFDLKNALWRIPASDVKQLQQVIEKVDNRVPDYIVPLSRQALEIVKELLSYHMRGQRYLIANRTNPLEAMSENTLNQALKNIGFKRRLCTHGIRHTISTALNDLKYDKDFIEAQLSHSDTNKVRATYNHAQYIEPRREMMQEWADLLDKWEQEALDKINNK
jgi:integrase